MILVEVVPDPEAAGRRAAELIAQALLRASTDGGRGAWAISGGESPVPMFGALRELGLPWPSIDTWQVDERIAPLGDRDRNRTIQERALPAAALDGVRWMPVDDEDAEAAARAYGATLPDRFDVVHLGLGADGHTASLVPSDAVLEVVDRDVAVTDAYQGRRRMTLTFRGLARAGRIVWLVTGSDKGDAVRRLLARDPSIPASVVRVDDQVLVTDLPIAT